MDMGSDFDRLLFFEHARKTAEVNYTKNPLDADVRLLFSLISSPPPYLSIFLCADLDVEYR